MNVQAKNKQDWLPDNQNLYAGSPGIKVDQKLYNAYLAAMHLAVPKVDLEWRGDEVILPIGRC